MSKSTVLSKASAPLSSFFNLNYFKKDTPKSVKAPPLTHVVWIDCSGSMWDELPLIREQLKNKLPIMVRPEDSVSLGWFSGRGEFGFIQERIKIDSVKDLSTLNSLIDRFLRPQGLTGFTDPIEKTVESYSEEDNVSFTFATDGHHNQGSFDKVLEACSKLAKKIVTATIIEYGPYCNHSGLQSMAETLGGTLIYAEDFPKFDSILEAQFKATSSKRTTLNIPDQPYKGIVFGITEKGVVSYKPEDNGDVFVGKDETLYWVTEAQSPDNKPKRLEGNHTEFLSVLSVLVNKGDSKAVKRMLTSVGDYELFEKYSKAIGKQALLSFSELLSERIKNGTGLYRGGFHDRMQLDENEYCLMDFLEDLSETDSFIKIDSPDFKYKRAGVKSVAKVQKVLNKAKYMELLDAYISSQKDVDPEDLAEKSKELLEQSYDEKHPPKFEYIYPVEGVSVNNLVFNSEIPNTSISVTLPVVVKFDEEPPFGIPQEFESFKIKNYMIIKSGLKNVSTLVLRLPKDLFTKCVNKGLIPNRYKWDPNTFYVVNLANLPITNISRCKQVSCQELAEKEVTILNTKAKQKVYKYFLDKYFQSTLNKSNSFEEAYTVEGSLWLKEQGITSYGGFNPKTESAKAGETYQVQKIETSIKGCSSIPAVKDVLARVAEGKKLNYLQNLMNEYYNTLDSEIKAKEAILNKETILDFLRDEAKAQDKAIRKANIEVAQSKAALVLGQTWFSDRESVDDNKATAFGLEVTFKLLDADVAI